MIGSLTDAAVGAVDRYGFLALFLFTVLETSFVLHFVPSEVVIPLAAVAMVSGPASFALFLGVVWVGSILGSVLAYELFGVRGEAVLRRYGHLVYLPEEELDRATDWFRRWGTTSMFWGRLLPVVRTPISIPAGVAGMDRGRFLVYSAGGWLLYMGLLSGLGYSDGESASPIGYGWLLLVDAAGGTGPAAGVLAVVTVAVAVAAVAVGRRRSRA